MAENDKFLDTFCETVLFNPDNYDENEDFDVFINETERQFLDWLIPFSEAIVFVEPNKKDLEKIEEKGEFLATQMGYTCERSWTVNWAKIEYNEEKKVCIVKKLSELFHKLNYWLDYNKYDNSANTKRRAASIIFELYELIFAALSKTDAIHVNWSLSKHDEISCPWNTLTDSKRKKCNNTMDDVIRAFCFKMSQVASLREAYVAHIGVLKHKEVGLEVSLISLPLFGKILCMFSTSRASFLVTANTVIYSTFFKVQNEFKKEAEKNFVFLQEKDDFEKTDILPYYFKWLVGCSIYLKKYFDELDDAVYLKQSDDYHNVAPNSCGSLLIKVVKELSLSFEILEKSTPKWRPVDGAVSKAVGLMTEYYESEIKAILYQFVKLFALVHADYFFTQLEKVNVVTPLDDGSGDLEITPFEIAVLVATILLHETLYNSELIPKVLSNHRYTNLGLCVAYVLLCCSSDFPLNSCNSAEASTIESQLFDATSIDYQKKNRAAQYGLKVLIWACTSPSCMPAINPETFETMFTFGVRPSRVILSMLLATMKETVDDRLKNFLITKCVMVWLERYTVECRLEILFCLIKETYSFFSSTNCIIELELEIFEKEVIRILRNEAYVEKYPLGVFKSTFSVCRKVLCCQEPISEIYTALLIVLNLLSFIFLHKNLQPLQNAFRTEKFLQSKKIVPKAKTSLLMTLDQVLEQIISRTDLELKISSTTPQKNNHIALVRMIALSLSSKVTQ